MNLQTVRKAMLRKVAAATPMQELDKVLYDTYGPNTMGSWPFEVIQFRNAMNLKLNNPELYKDMKFTVPEGLTLPDSVQMSLYGRVMQPNGQAANTAQAGQQTPQAATPAPAAATTQTAAPVQTAATAAPVQQSQPSRSMSDTLVYGRSVPVYNQPGNQYVPFHGNNFTPQQVNELNHTWGTLMGMKGPITSVRMNNGVVTGINGIGIPQNITPQVMTNTAPPPRPNLVGMTRGEARQAAGVWANQTVNSMENTWKWQNQNRQNALANNQALRGKPMTGRYWDSRAKQWVAINGTAGGNNFSRRDLIALQGPQGYNTRQRRNFPTAANTTNWKSVPSTHYRFQTNMSNPRSTPSIAQYRRTVNRRTV